MNLSDEQILDMLTNYISDDRYKQAVMIDGEWGSGKTFFVKEKLLKKLRAEIPSNSRIEPIKRQAYYISLYGLDSYDQIMNELYNEVFGKFLNKKFGNKKAAKIGKVINLGTKLIMAGLKYFNIESKDLPSLADINKIKDATIIFDDLERCNIDINQLLGFINNLVEHNNIKVILIANQDAIGRIGLSEDLPQKYLVALDSRINLNDSEKNGNNKKNESNGYIDKEQLISRTDKLFSENILYNKIKEKLIGLTIHYKVTFSNIYESIVKKYVKDEETKMQLNNKKSIVLGIFEEQHHNNIRTLIFGVMAYERFFKIINEIDFDAQYLQDHKDKILKYTMETSIKIKLGKPTYFWKNNAVQTGLFYFGDNETGKNIFGYKFVDDYLLHHYLDSKGIKKEIELSMDEKKKADDVVKQKEALAYNKLWGSWWELEDEQITELLSKMKSELENQDYPPYYFKDIIFKLIQIDYQNDLGWIKYEDYIDPMVTRLKNYEDNLEMRQFEILSDDPDLEKKYNELAKPLFNIILEKEKQNKKSHNYYLNDSEPWNEEFCKQMKKNSPEYVMEGKFFFYMDTDKIIEKLDHSNVKEIYYFLKGLRVVYDFSNSNEYFKADIPYLGKLIKNIDVKKLSHNKHTRKIALNGLLEKLQEFLANITK